MAHKDVCASGLARGSRVVKTGAIAVAFSWTGHTLRQTHTYLSTHG